MRTWRKRRNDSGLCGREGTQATISGRRVSAMRAYWEEEYFLAPLPSYRSPKSNLRFMEPFMHDWGFSLSSSCVTECHAVQVQWSLRHTRGHGGKIRRQYCYIGIPRLIPSLAWTSASLALMSYRPTDEDCGFATTIANMDLADYDYYAELIAKLRKLTFSLTRRMNLTESLIYEQRRYSS